MNPIPAAADRTLEVRKRSDLQISQQTYQGQRSWVIKDPISLRYFRLRDDEFTIWNMLDGSATLGLVKQEVERLFRPRRITLRQIESLLALFRQRELVIGGHAQESEALARRQTESQQQRRLSWWLNPLAIRFPGIDPEPLLRTTLPYVRWTFQPVALFGWLLLMLTALLLIAVQYEVFQAKLPEFHTFFGSENLILFAVAVAGSKVIHELGHAFACKRFGGECHEIGPMLLVFTPALYCDTSDSWMLPSRWQRAAVGAAGMCAELILAAICTLVWWNTRPSPLHYTCLAVMFVSGVSTLLFNANPLLRYDGYYILSDLLEIPNLASRARAALHGWLASWFLAERRQKNPLLPRKHRAWFVAYAIASTAYRYVVLVVICWFVAEVLRPYGLQVIGHGLIVLAVAGMVITPIKRGVAWLRMPGSIASIRRGRTLLSVLIVVLILAFILLVPLPRRAFAPVAIVPLEAHRVFVKEEGSLVEVLVAPGDRVNAGDPLARLVNRDLEIRLMNLEAKFKRTSIRLANLRKQQGTDPTAEQQIPPVRSAIEDLKRQMENVHREIDALTIKAPRGGAILEPPHREPAEANDRLPSWSGSPLEPENQGCLLQRGELFCLIADPDQWQAAIAVEQGNIGDVRAGEPVAIRLVQFPGETLDSEISRIVQGRSGTGSEAFARDPIWADTIAEWEQADGTPPPYLALVPLSSATVPLQTGYRGEARVRLKRKTLAWSLWRYASETLTF